MRLINSLGYSLLAQILLFSINIVTLIFIARLIDPVYFGYFSIYLIVFSIFSSIQDMGLTQAYLKLENYKETDRNVFFTLNMILSVILVLILLMSIPIVQFLYETKFYMEIVLVMGLSIIIHSFGIQSRTHLTKNMNFKAMFNIVVISSFIGSIAGIIFAYFSNSVYPFLVKGLMTSIVSLCVTYKYETQKFKFESYSVIATYIDSIKYSIGIFFNKSLYDFGQTIDQLVIAKVFGNVNLAYYSKAIDLSKYPNSIMGSAISTPFFSAISKKITSKLDMYVSYIFVYFLTAGFLSLSMYISSADVVNLMLGNRWKEAALYLKLLSIFAFGRVISSIVTFILTNEKKMKLLLHLNSYSILITSSSAVLLGLLSVDIVVFVSAFAFTYTALWIVFLIGIVYIFLNKIKSIFVICKLFINIILIPLILLGYCQYFIDVNNSFLYLSLLYFSGYILVFVLVFVFHQTELSHLNYILKNRY